MFSLWLTVAQNPFLVWGNLTAELGAREGRGTLGIIKRAVYFQKMSPNSMDSPPRTGGGSVWDVGPCTKGSPLAEVSVMLEISRLMLQCTLGLPSACKIYFSNF